MEALSQIRLRNRRIENKTCTKTRLWQKVLRRLDWKLSQLAVGHSLSIATARAWGLYISTSRGMTSAGIEEPAQFNEPGVFLVRPDRTLYWASVQSMPFARPHFREIVAALDFVIAKDYPARGEA